MVEQTRRQKMNPAPATDPRPLLPERSAELTTRGGVQVQVRSAAPGDEALLADFFTHVAPDDLRFRFLSPIRKPDRAMLASLVEVDHTKTENLLAFDAQTHMLVATAMIAADDGMERAEVAIAIRADYKQKGLGWTLLGHVADYARARGIKAIESIESRDNREAIGVERDMGFEAHAVDGEATLVRLVKRLD